MKKKILEKKTPVSFNKERLLWAAAASKEELFDKYQTTLKGFDEDQAEEMRELYGRNEITTHDKDTLFQRLVRAYINPFTVVLFVLALISLITDVLIVAKGERDFTAVIIVLTMVFISGTLNFVQETRSGKSAEKLKAMVKTTISVERKGLGKVEIPLAEVVVGDIVYLAAGDMIPADLRVLSAKDLFVSQASLTGESEPIEKFPAPADITGTDPLGMLNLAFMGSNVVNGSATAIVIAVGDETVFGSMAKTLTTKKAVTSFEKGVNSVSWLLIRFMLIMVPVVLFINGFTKKDWLEAFLFALSVGVGLTPEMLPMIVTTNLAKGAVQMSKKKTIIKNLNSIQNFGAMDVLCTDKTGTLTQDKVALERYLDIHGNVDNRVLRHAFLNSYYQTGLKNLMDVAILNHIGEEGINELTLKYEKVDEIPFDFNRRRMSVVIKDHSGKTQLITKGAVEEMLNVCAYAEYQGTVIEISKEIKKEILSTVKTLNNDGMRVLAVAQKTNPASEGLFSVKDESEMVFMGYLAFLDPPKETTRAAIQALNDHGVAVKILTGDNDGVTRCICRQVGLNINKILLGSEIEDMDDERLAKEVEACNVFAKLSPQQKSRIVTILRANGHVVGFMGDGINDAAAMRAADVGISVDTAVDIAKESADIILLEKDLTVLEQGVIEGRKTYANIIKYIKMTASSNFGNMFSVLVASAFLPFLPMLPLQILILNLIYDISCISIPWDNVDEDYLKKPRKWDASSIGSFMLWIGPTSSVFDITTYALLYFVICPAALGGSYKSGNVDQTAFMMMFNAGWFIESLWTQTLVIHMIRTPKIPFIQSRASAPVTLLTCAAIAIGTAIPFTAFGARLEMMGVPMIFFAWLALTVILYMALVILMKKFYIKRYGELL